MSTDKTQETFSRIPKILHYLKVRERRNLLERKLRWKVWATVLYCCCCSVAKSCLILCKPVDCSMPGFPVLHYLPVFSNSCPLSQGGYPIISSSATLFFSCPQSFLASGSFQSRHQTKAVIFLLLLFSALPSITSLSVSTVLSHKVVGKLDSNHIDSLQYSFLAQRKIKT